MTREEFVSKYKVGDWVAIGPEQFGPRQIMYLSGVNFFVGRYSDGREDTPSYDYDWLPYTPPAPQRKKRLMSPAMFLTGEAYISSTLFESAAKAAEFTQGARYSWPATQIIDGKAVPVVYEVGEL